MARSSLLAASVARYPAPMKPLLNLDEVTLTRSAHGGRFESLDGPIGSVIGARQLGYSLTVVPPGKRSCPFHNHHVNEEMAFIVSGRGTVRIGPTEYPVRGGDVIANPAGGAELAHQIINTSDEELRYLSVSTMIPTDVVEYPDSDRIFVTVGTAPGDPDKSGQTFRHFGHKGAATDYWDGED